MRRPKRLFRRSGLAAQGGNLPGVRRVLAGSGMLAVAFAAVALMGGVPAELFGRVPAVSGTLSADATRVAVVDGDTLRLDQTVVRLLGVQAPRRGETCRSADGAAYDCGREAAAALGHILHGRPVACRLDGRDRHGLPQGECDAGGTPVNRAIVASGWARADSAAGALGGAEQEARAAMRGVWRGTGSPTF